MNNPLRGLLSAVIEALTEYSDEASPTTQQVDDENHKRHNQQQVDQAAPDAESKSQKPQNQ
jgi:hypothetical protein